MFTQPPRANLNKAQPLSMGLLGYWPYWDRTGNPSDVLKGANGTALGSNMAWSDEPIGRGVGTTTANDNTYISFGTCPHVAPRADGCFSFSFWFKSNVAWTSQAAWGRVHGRSHSALGDQILICHNGSQIRYGYGTKTPDTTSLSIATGVWTNLTMVRDAVNLLFYQDARLVGSGAHAGVLPTIPPTIALTALRRADGGFSIAGSIGVSAFWNRPLAQEDVARFYSDPYLPVRESEPAAFAPAVIPPVTETPLPPSILTRRGVLAASSGERVTQFAPGQVAVNDRITQAMRRQLDTMQKRLKALESV